MNRDHAAARGLGGHGGNDAHRNDLANALSRYRFSERRW
jgi:hypothetical protein